MTPAGRTICLAMIVKDEAPVIGRCLASVMALIDHWIIVDTGSRDGTQRIIRETMAGLPGALFERPWRDFGHNRTEALALARPHGDYSLIIDADDEMVLPDGFIMPELTEDSYFVDIIYGGVTYRRQQLIKNSLHWRYEGVLHEFLVCEEAQTSGNLPISIRVNHEGRRSRDPETYRKDAAILARALETEKSSFLIARYTFYLAQSYRDCGEHAASVKAYLRRAALGWWDQEVFYSLYQAARQMEALGGEPEDVLATYQRATDACPTRVEAAHAASRFCRQLGQNKKGWAIAKPHLGKPPPPGGLFVEPWIYEYGLFDEYSINAYWAGRYRESLDGTLRALASDRVPALERARLIQNARFALEKLADDAGDATDAGKGGGAPAPARHLHARLPAAAPRVLLAILAKQKEPVLALYLKCLEALDYPKSAIYLYVRTNNNTDRTAEVLRRWLERVASSYAGVEYDDSDVAQPVETFAVHEWNALRFQVLAEIRNTSLRRTAAQGCDYYFVVDADNFVAPSTLRDLVCLNLPIVAPLLRHVDVNSLYSNFHADIDANGYFQKSRRYNQIVLREITGVIEVPVVHCTYLVRADVIANLRYDDSSGRHEYVVFSEQARSNGVQQYLDNRQIYGYVTLDDDAPEKLASQLPTIAESIRGASAFAAPRLK